MMMFLHYFIMGAWFVVLSTYLLSKPSEGGLGFSPSQNAWAHSTMAIAGLIGPPFLGLLADRLFSAQKLMGFLYLAGAILMGAAAWWCHIRQPLIAADPENAVLIDQTFLVFYLVLQLYAVINLTTGPLTGVVALRNVPSPTRHFASVRVIGTVGWIVAGFVVAVLVSARSAEPLFLAAGMSLVMGIYSFTLPSTPPTGRGGSLAKAFGLPALVMFRDRSFIVFIVCAFSMAAVQSFYTLYSNKYLTDIGVPHPPAVQTLAQWGEVACMLLLPLAVLRFGMKTVMIIGLAGWGIRNALFAVSSPSWAVAGLCLHGVCFTFFFILAIQYVDQMAPSDLRGSAQGIYSFVIWGAGTLVGNWVGAEVGVLVSTEGLINWSNLWLMPTVASVAITLVFALLFRPREREIAPAETPLPPYNTPHEKSATAPSPAGLS